MNKNDYLRESSQGIRYFDYSEFAGAPCGVVVRNDNIEIRQIDEFIYDIVRHDTAAINEKFKIIRLNQQHNSVIIDSKNHLNKPADGVYTVKSNHILTVRTADCFSIFFFDGLTAAIVHVGWRGVLSGIIAEFFHVLKNLNKDNLKVILGPGIRECCFEVSSEVFVLFSDDYRIMRDDKYFIDIRGLILDELKRFGVKYVLDNSVCTACNTDMFYSYRRDGVKVKQMISFISTGG